MKCAPVFPLSFRANKSVQKFEDRDSALRMVHAYLFVDGKRTHREIMDVSGITLSELWFLLGVLLQ